MKKIIQAILFLFIVLITGGFYPKIFAGDQWTIIAVGDIMMGSTGPRGLLPPNDGQDLFKNISQNLNGADIILGNLEGPLLDEGEPSKCREEKSRFCFEFKSPTRYGLYLKQAGFNVLNIANNHTLDFGLEGIKSTLATLNSLGIKPVGGKTIAEFKINGKKIALVGFSFLSSDYSYSKLEIEKSKEIVRKLKETYDLVIVSFHGGAEGSSALPSWYENEIFLGEDRGNGVIFSRSVIDAGADLVLGHGPHVLRALEIYNGKLIAYSLGNFLTYGMFNLKGPNGISVILKIKLNMENGEFLEGLLIPVKLVNGGIPEYDPNKGGIQLLKELTNNNGNNFNIRISDEGELSRIK